jgi:hypothetical protein
MKNKFSPATDTLAVMALRPASEPVAKLAITADCVLLTLIVSIVRGVLTPYRESHITLKAGQTVYFVASNERDGYSYIVFLYSDGSSLCSCKDGCQHRACPHTADAASYEARCAVEEQATKAGLIAHTDLPNGTVLYEFQSSSDPDYCYWITSTVDGRIDTSTHEDCKGFHYHRHCAHMDYVIADMTPAYEARMARDKAHKDAFYAEYKSSEYYRQTFGKLA